MARRANCFRYPLLLDRLTPGVAAIKKDGDLHWSIDVDPVDLY